VSETPIHFENGGREETLWLLHIDGHGSDNVRDFKGIEGIAGNDSAICESAEPFLRKKTEAGWYSRNLENDAPPVLAREKVGESVINTYPRLRYKSR
jgi:hypothetical protein